MKRKRLTHFVLILLVVALGLGSRSNYPALPVFVKTYAGDVLWALAAYLSIGFLFPRWPVGKTALAAGLLCLAVELSQLYQAPWLNQIRRTRIGALLLGEGFLWSDLACYAAGVGAGALVETLFAGRGKKSSQAKPIRKTRGKSRSR